MKKKITILLVTLTLVLGIVGVAYAGGKGHYHFKGKCQQAACHCTEFWAEAGTSRCYYCGHMDFVHKK